METTKKSQKSEILAYLKLHKAITSFEAFEMFHITRLASIIFRLRKEGHSIRTEVCAGANEYGNYQYALYILEDESDEITCN